jgi:hypothetical protein
MRHTITILLLILAPTIHSAELPLIHPPLRVINGDLYDFTQAIAKESRTHRIQGRVIHVFESGGILVDRFVGMEVNQEDIDRVARYGSFRDMLALTAAAKAAKSASPARILALDPSIRGYISPKIETTLIWDIPSTTKLTFADLYALPSGTFTYTNHARRVVTVPAFSYGTPTNSTRGFPFLVKVTPSGLSRTTLIPSPTPKPLPEPTK